MPVTTSALAESIYGDPDHFAHVLEHLFVPAVENAGYRAVRPTMSGSDLIHAEIIRNLESADLVLCDITSLNANVFFEFGIRTALDRSVAIVRDDRTDALPFDTSILNTHTYESTLAPWSLESQIDLLSNHLKVAASTSQGRNPLWQYFGLTQRADPGAEVGESPTDAKLELILRELRNVALRDDSSSSLASIEAEELPRSSGAERALARRVSRPPLPKQVWQNRPPATALPSSILSGEYPAEVPPGLEPLLLSLADIADERNARIWVSSIEGRVITLDPRPYMLGPDDVRKMQERGRSEGYEIRVLQDMSFKPRRDVGSSTR